MSMGKVLDNTVKQNAHSKTKRTRKQETKFYE